MEERKDRREIMLMIESDEKGETLEVELIKAIEIEKVFRPVTSHGRRTELLGFYFNHFE